MVCAHGLRALPPVHIHPASAPPRHTKHPRSSGRGWDRLAQLSALPPGRAGPRVDQPESHTISPESSSARTGRKDCAGEGWMRPRPPDRPPRDNASLPGLFWVLASFMLYSPAHSSLHTSGELGGSSSIFKGQDTMPSLARRGL